MNNLPKHYGVGAQCSYIGCIGLRLALALVTYECIVACTHPQNNTLRPWHSVTKQNVVVVFKEGRIQKSDCIKARNQTFLDFLHHIRNR